MWRVGFEFESRLAECVGESPVVRAAADLATGPAQQHQHQPDDDQDDADGPEERNGEHRTEKKEDESSNDHAGAVPVRTGKQTGFSDRPRGT